MYTGTPFKQYCTEKPGPMLNKRMAMSITKQQGRNFEIKHNNMPYGLYIC